MILQCFQISQRQLTTSTPPTSALLLSQSLALTVPSLPVASFHTTTSDEQQEVTKAEPSSVAVERKPYSPFQVDLKTSKAEYALARVDDLVNWARKVRKRRHKYSDNSYMYIQ